MQVDFSWNGTDGIIRAVVGGPANAQDYHDRFEQFLTENPALRAAPVLWDLRKLDYSSFTPEEVMRVAALRRELHGFRHDTKAAVLIASGIDYIPMMFLKQKAAVSDMPLEIFLNEAEAVGWLTAAR